MNLSFKFPTIDLTRPNNPQQRGIYLPFTPRALPVYCALLSLFGASAGFAQPSGNMDEIVVSEQRSAGGLDLDSQSQVGGRLGLSVLDTPASIELIGSEQMLAKGDYDTLSAITRSTGMVSSASPGNGSSSVSTRGFNGHGSVLAAYDGTRLYVGAGTVSFPSDTWLLDRVEIMRGPGSVIHGIGATGASINYVPKKAALNQTGAELMMSGGSFGLQRVGLGGNLPVGDNIAIRADLLHHEKDGYVDRSEEERNAGAISMLYRPNQDFNLTFSVDYSDNDSSPYWGTPLVDGNASQAMRRNNYNVADGLVEYEDLWPRLKMEWQLSDNILLRNDTFYMDVNRHWRNLESYAYNPNTQVVEREFYLEILHDQEQLGTRSDLAIDFSWGAMTNKVSLGFEINQVDFTHINNSPYAGSSSVALEDFDPGLFAQAALSETTVDYITDSQFYALFFDDLLTINEQWSLVFGLRYDNIEFERTDLARSNGQSADRFDASFDDISLRIGTVFKVTDNLSLYAQYSTAPDSIGSIASLNLGQQDLKLTQGEQFEVGVKHQFWQGRGEYSLAAFRIEKKNLFTQATLGGPVEQIGQQSSQGLEFGIGVRPIDAFGINLNAAWVEAEFDDYASYAGNTPRNAPELTANLWLDWSITDAWSLNGGLRYVDERYTSDSNTERLPPYLVADASLFWQVNTSIAAFVRGRNLTDEKDYVLSNYGSRQWIFAEPRALELGVELSF